MSNENATNDNASEQDEEQSPIADSDLYSIDILGNGNNGTSKNNTSIGTIKKTKPTNYTPFVVMGGVFLLIIAAVFIIVTRNRSRLRKGGLSNSCDSISISTEANI
uniref:Mid2 domain-containing protein n=1 Tax=Strongyloides papillosus TaxID=174720 RepID=A0A0N5C7V6_STREA